ncbi:MAG: hypothetical protein VX112_02285 [Pseudomonadota bacterium]|nr:hypothetical protein [Pseudomonadota bacterium]
MPAKTDALKNMSRELSELHQLAKLSELTYADAGSLYHTAKKLETIARSLNKFRDLALESATKGKPPKPLDNLLDDHHVSLILNKDLILQIRGLCKRITTLMVDIWEHEKIDVKKGVKLNLTLDKVKSKVISHMDKLRYSKDKELNESTMIKTVNDMLKDRPELKTSLEKNIDLYLKDEHGYNDEKRATIRQFKDLLTNRYSGCKSGLERIRQCQEKKKKEMLWLTSFKAEMGKLYTNIDLENLTDKEIEKVEQYSSPEKTKEAGAKNELGERRKLLKTLLQHYRVFKTELMKEKRNEEALTNAYTNMIANYESSFISPDVAPEIARLTREKEEKNLFSGDIEYKTEFFFELESQMGFEKNSIEPKSLYEFAINLYEECSKQAPDDSQKSELRDLLMTLYSLNHEKILKELQKEESKLCDEIGKSFVVNKGKIDGSNQSDEALGTKENMVQKADSIKENLETAVIVKLNSIVHNLQKGLKYIAESHNGFVEVQRTTKTLHKHQNRVKQSRKFLFTSLSPLLLKGYALSRVTGFTLLAVCFWVSSIYITGPVVAMLKTLAITFGACAGEKFLSQFYSASVRRKVSLLNSKKPAFLTSFYYMPSSGTTESWLTACWVALPYVFWAFTLIPGVGIRASLAAFGKLFENVYLRYAVTGTGLLAMFVSKSRKQSAALPQTPSKLSETEIAILFKNRINSEIINQAFETVAIDFVERFSKVIDRVLGSPIDQELKVTLTTLNHFKNKKNNVSKTDVALAVKKLSENIEIGSEKPDRNNLVAEAKKLRSAAESRAIDKMRANYNKEMEGLLTHNHYRIDHVAKSHELRYR